MKAFSSKWILLIAIATHSASASFIEIDDDAEFENGFYGGLALGINWANADWNGLSSISLVDNNTPGAPNSLFESWTPQGETHDTAKILGRVALGYEWVGSRLYLGAEVSGTFSDTRSFDLDDNKTFSQTVESVIGFPASMLTGSSLTKSTVTLGNNEFDIDLKPGLLIWENFLAYARVGLAFTQLKIDNSGMWTEEVNEFPGMILAPSASSHESKNVVGFRAGAGMEYLITEYLGISLDYIFTDYGSIKTLAQNGAENVGPFAYNKVYGVHAPEVKVSTHALMAGAVYHF